MKNRFVKSLVLGVCIVSILTSPFSQFYTAYAEAKKPGIHFTSEKKIYDFKNRTIKDSLLWFNTPVDSKIKEIWITVKKGSNSCDYFVTGVKGKLNTSVFLPFGPGKYKVEIYKKNDLSLENYYSYKSLTVTNTDPAMNIGNQTVAESKLIIDIPIDKEIQEVLIEVKKDNQKTDFVAAITDGRLSKTIFFPFGKGSYKVDLYKSKTANTEMYDDGQVGFTVNNSDERDLQYLLPSDAVESDNQEIIDLAMEITKNATSDMEKTEAIHDWVSKNIAYDAENFYKNNIKAYSALETLHSRVAICNGYAKLNAALHRAVGIKATVIGGVVFDPDKGETYESVAGKDENGHNWNEILIDGEWIIEDPTWDAGSLDDDTKTFKFNFRRDYFNPSPEEFAKDHKKELIEDMRK